MNKPKSRSENIVIQEMNEELLIYDLKDNKAFCLNETSAIIYQLCDGKRTVAEIKNSVANQLNQSVNDELIWLALDGLKKEGLLENNTIEIDFNGLNRRQVIKKVGLASMIILPLISSIVAPSAVMAQSGTLPLLAACTSSPQCASGQCNSSGPSAGQCCVMGTQNIQQAPSTVVNTCNNAFSCALLPPACCSGMTSFTVNNCFAPNSATGECRCA